MSFEDDWMPVTRVSHWMNRAIWTWQTGSLKVRAKIICLVDMYPCEGKVLIS